MLFVELYAMKVILDIEDDKANFVLELLTNLKFVKARPVSAYKAELLEGIATAAEEMHRIKKGDLKAISTKELLDEL